MTYFDLPDNLVSLMRSNLTDYHSGRSSNWIYDDFPRFDLQEYPRLGIVFQNSPYQPFGIGCPQYKRDILIRFVIIAPRESSYKDTSDSISISYISKAAPARVTTSSAHGLSDWDKIVIDSVSGMTEINDESYKIEPDDSTHFYLRKSDTTGYTAYSSGGKVYQYSKGRKICEAIENDIEAVLGNTTHINTIKGWGYERPIFKNLNSFNKDNIIGLTFDVRFTKIS